MMETEVTFLFCFVSLLYLFIYFPGFQYNLSLGDVLWNPNAVRAELESQFGFDGLRVEKLLSYTAQLTKVN